MYMKKDNLFFISAMKMFKLRDHYHCKSFIEQVYQFSVAKSQLSQFQLSVTKNLLTICSVILVRYSGNFNLIHP